MRKTLSLCIVLLLALSASAQAPKAKYRLQITTDRPDAIYDLGQTVTFTAALLEGDQPATWKLMKYVVTRDGAKELTSGSSDAPRPIEAKLDEPGFLKCEITATAPDGSTVKGLAGAGVAPTKIQPSSKAPADFERFWMEKKQLVEAEPIKAELSPVKSPKEGIETFDVQVNCAGGKPLSGYLALPADAKPKSLPAILFPHSAGVRSSQLDVAVRGAGMGAMALDFNAHGIPNGKPDAFYKDLADGELKAYATTGADDREKAYFLGMYMRLFRAIQYITERPEWDGKTLIVYGSSQGGGQALVAAGIEPRVTLCLASVPAMCDHTGGLVGRTPGWPRIMVWNPHNPDKEKMLATVGYFDAVNFAARIKREAAITVGFIDITCSPAGVYAAFNSIPSRSKYIINRPDMGHAFPPDLLAEFDRRAKEHIAKMKGQAMRIDGYRGIWFELGEKYEHGDKYSGGLGTYTANHVPIAVYAPAVNKSFFRLWGNG